MSDDIKDAAIRALLGMSETSAVTAVPPGRDGAIFWRPLDDGYEVVVYPMSYGKARLCFGEQGEYGGILNAFCYAVPARAIEAAEVWDGQGDPLDGWHRQPMTGRRRENGDPNKEFVRE